MDYLEGALVIEREAMIGSWFKHLGPLQRGNALLTPANLWDTVMDGEFYALRRENLIALVQDYAKPRLYVAEKNDCDNITFKGIVDLQDATDALQWDRNPAVCAIAYNSKTLGSRTSRLGGYHLAGLGTYWDPQAGDLFPLVIQWPGIYQNTVDKYFPAQFQEPIDEMDFWVGAFGF